MHDKIPLQPSEKRRVTLKEIQTLKYIEMYRVLQ